MRMPFVVCHVVADRQTTIRQHRSAAAANNDCQSINSHQSKE
jgi:hypothetical protein